MPPKEQSLEERVAVLEKVMGEVQQEIGKLGYAYVHLGTAFRDYQILTNTIMKDHQLMIETLILTQDAIMKALSKSNIKVKSPIKKKEPKKIETPRYVA